MLSFQLRLRFSKECESPRRITISKLNSGIRRSKEIVQTINEARLPLGWSIGTICDLVGKEGVFVDGDWVESKDQDQNGNVRLIQLADIGDGEYRDRSSRFLTYEKALELGCTFLDRGDVLVARMPDPLGRACIFPGDKKRAFTVVDVAIVRPGNADVNNHWLMYFINASAFRAAVASMQSGSTRKRISRRNLASIALPVPPPNHQKSIVAEIEKQFSRLDEAVANLKRIKANLKRYKAAVLKATLEANLTRANRLRQSILSQAFSGRLVVQDGKDSTGMKPQAYSLAVESKACYGNDTLKGGNYQ